MRKDGHVLGGVLLVAGTTIGAAVLAIPVSTGLAGFIPSAILFLLCWAYLITTAFLLLEVNLWIDGDVNLMTMAKTTLGRPGKIVGWGAYLLLLYTLTTAYMIVSGSLFVHIGDALTGYTLPDWAGPFPLLLIFGFFVFEGTRSVDLVNRVLMVGLGLTFIYILFSTGGFVEEKRLLYRDWSHFSTATSVIVTAFGFHIIIPSLTTYLDHDLPGLKKSLLIGSFIPLAMYLVWEGLMMGVIPLEGKGGLIEAAELGAPVTRSLRVVTQSQWIGFAAESFEFFAILTSFLGVSLSLLDFLADGLNIKKTTGGRLFLCLLTYIPPSFFAAMYPRAFFTAMSVAGAFGVAILLGLLPALMVWAGRYRCGFKGEFKVPGGKVTLAAVMVFSLAVTLAEILL